MALTAGIDFGHEKTVVSLPTGNGIELVPNRCGERVTPTFVTYGSDRRSWGSSAEREQMRSPSGAIPRLKQLIGLPFSSALRASFASDLGLHLTALDDGLTGIAVTFRGQRFLLRPEQALAYFVKSAVPIADQYVISGAPSWGPKQRRIVEQAFRIAGARCAAIVNGTTAAAVAYAMMHRHRLPTKEWRRAIFLDFGAAALTVAVARMRRGSVEMMAVAVEPQLGGSELTTLFADYLAAKVRLKYRTDTGETPRARIRFRRAVEKLKRTLSVNTAVNFDVQCAGDVDVSFLVRREEFTQQIQERVGKIAQAIEQALALARIKIEKLDVVELLGGGSRIPIIREKVAAIVGKEPTQTLNADECCATGAGYIAALMSPTFRVPLVVHDVLSIPVTAQWDDQRTTVFDRLSVLPATTGVTIRCPGKLAVSIFSGDEEIGRLQIETEKEVDVLVRFRLSISAIVDIDSVTGSSRYTVVWFGQLPDEKVREMVDVEEAMAAADRLEELADEAKNALEATVFTLDRELRDSADWLSPAERAHGQALLDGVRIWHEENEFERLAAEEYQTRAERIQVFLDVIVRRRMAHAEISEKVAALKTRIGSIEKALNADRSHLETAEWQGIREELSRVAEQMARCEIRDKFDDSPFDISDLVHAVENAAGRQGRLRAAPITAQNDSMRSQARVGRTSRSGSRLRSSRSGSRTQTEDACYPPHNGNNRFF